MNTPTVKKLFEVAEDYRPLGRPIMTGDLDFDKAMDGGIRGGELITISGQAKHGKTSYALWLTKQICDSGVPVLWFTYEMNPWYLKEKLAAIGADEEFTAYVPIKHENNTKEFILKTILEARDNHACKVVFIDHLHYLIPPNQEKNMSSIIGGVMRQLKTLAVETDTIIYLTAHMRRLGAGEKVSVDAVRDSALIINESDYVFLVERLKSKEKFAIGKKNNLGEEYSNITKVTLAANRRTGSSFFRLFEVDRGNFNKLNSKDYEEYI